MKRRKRYPVTVYQDILQNRNKDRHLLEQVLLLFLVINFIIIDSEQYHALKNLIRYHAVIETVMFKSWMILRPWRTIRNIMGKKDFFSPQYLLHCKGQMLKFWRTFDLTHCMLLF